MITVQATQEALTAAIKETLGAYDNNRTWSRGVIAVEMEEAGGMMGSASAYKHVAPEEFTVRLFDILRREMKTHMPVKRIRNRMAEERCIIDGEFWPCRTEQNINSANKEGGDERSPRTAAGHTWICRDCGIKGPEVTE